MLNFLNRGVWRYVVFQVRNGGARVQHCGIVVRVQGFEPVGRGARINTTVG